MLVSFSLSRETKALLSRAGNASRYVDCLVAHYPPPVVEDLEGLSVVVKSGHPWTRHPSGGLRHDLPRYGGETPCPLKGAYSWNETSVMDSSGELFNRMDWER